MNSTENMLSEDTERKDKHIFLETENLEMDIPFFKRSKYLPFHYVCVCV